MQNFLVTVSIIKSVIDLRTSVIPISSTKHILKVIAALKILIQYLFPSKFPVITFSRQDYNSKIPQATSKPSSIRTIPPCPYVQLKAFIFSQSVSYFAIFKARNSLQHHVAPSSTLYLQNFSFLKAQILNNLNQANIFTL